MDKKTIMLVCSAGMSTSLLVTKMLKAAQAKGKDVEIFASSSAEFEDNLAKKHLDAVLLGPQVRFLKDSYGKMAGEKGVPLDVINMADYGLMKGDKVLEQGLALIKK